MDTAEVDLKSRVALAFLDLAKRAMADQRWCLRKGWPDEADRYLLEARFWRRELEAVWLEMKGFRDGTDLWI